RAAPGQHGAPLRGDPIRAVAAGDGRLAAGPACGTAGRLKRKNLWHHPWVRAWHHLSAAAGHPPRGYRRRDGSREGDRTASAAQRLLEVAVRTFAMGWIRLQARLCRGKEDAIEGKDEAS